MRSGMLIRAFAMWTAFSSFALAAELPERMHIVVVFRSDAAPFWAAYLMDLHQTEGPDWKLRWWRVGPTIGSCSRVDVKAVSGRVSPRSVEGFFKTTNPCNVQPKTISRVYSNNNVVDALQHPADFVIVSDCASGRKILDLPDLPWKKMEQLRKRRHVVAKLREMYWDLGRAAGFGDRSPFADLDDDQDYRLQQQGEVIVPELRGGRYDEGLEGTWASVLAGYTGARHPKDLQPQVRVRESGGVELVGPELEYPPHAQMARIHGSVSVRFTAEADTGAVRLVGGSETGHPVLSKAALKSLEGWRVSNFEAVGLGPFTATIEYDLEPPVCRE